MAKFLIYILLSPQLIVFGTVDRIQKAMEKKEYEKAYELILKAYEKEPKNPGVSYYHAVLFFDEAFSKYNIDTARVAIVRAKDHFDNVSKELKEDLKEDGIVPEMIKNLYERIRDRAFQNTLKNLSITQINDFNKKFPQSVYGDILTFKSDSIEFHQARSKQTQYALIDFIKSHQTSIFKPQADSIVDGMRLRILEDTGSLNDYYKFLKDYPFTRHRRKVESYILKVSTAAHIAEKYEAFISLAKTDDLRKKAGDVLFYLEGIESMEFHPKSDSVKTAAAIQSFQLYPVIDKKLIGFYSQNGQLRISHSYVNIPNDYKCTLTKDDWIFASTDERGFILNKEGIPIISGVDDYKSISNDIGLVKKNEEWFLHHKSGFKILDTPIDNAELLGNKWIKFSKNGKWGLVSIVGLSIAQGIYDEIFKEGNFYVFERDDLLAVYTEELILDEIEDRRLSLEFKFDDIELVNNHSLIGFRGMRECLLDSTLKFLIPWGEHEIYPEKSGWYLKSSLGYRIYNPAEADIMDRYYPYLESNDGWLALKTETDWMLLPRNQGLLPSRGYDSIKLLNEHAAILINSESKKLLFSSGKEVVLKDEKIATFQNNQQFVTISNKDESSLYNFEGEKLLSGKFEKINFLNDSLVRVQIRGKQGLIKKNGDWVLNPVFDSIDEKDGLMLTLLNGKIGCYDPVINTLIATEYEARLERIQNYYLAKKNGKYGIINYTKEEVISFSYDEIRQWNDTSYLVKKDSQFSIIDQDEEPLYEPVEQMKLLTQNDIQSVYRYVKDGRYGLLSNQFGELLKAEFTDITNIGTSPNPLFFSDQHLNKAGFHVVSYIDQSGKLILSKAYTLEEFELILCD
jgi:hypothetical protein